MKLNLITKKENFPLDTSDACLPVIEIDKTEYRRSEYGDFEALADMFTAAAGFAGAYSRTTHNAVVAWINTLRDKSIFVYFVLVQYDNGVRLEVFLTCDKRLITIQKYVSDNHAYAVSKPAIKAEAK